jgi:hypothetical protein
MFGNLTVAPHNHFLARKSCRQDNMARPGPMKVRQQDNNPSTTLNLNPG